MFEKRVDPPARNNIFKFWDKPIDLKGGFFKKWSIVCRIELIQQNRPLLSPKELKIPVNLLNIKYQERLNNFKIAMIGQFGLAITS